MLFGIANQFAECSGVYHGQMAAAAHLTPPLSAISTMSPWSSHILATCRRADTHHDQEQLRKVRQQSKFRDGG